jgi:hypothetical protein
MYYKGPLGNGPTRKIKPGSIKHTIQAREKYWNLEKLIKRKTSDGEYYVDSVRLGHPDL